MEMKGVFEFDKRETIRQFSSIDEQSSTNPRKPLFEEEEEEEEFTKR